MKNTRLCKAWSKRHLPADLWPEILSRLPVKSLLRFRCVSKSWLSLVDDADFARLHLNNFKNNRDETHLLVVHGRQQNCVVRCSDTFETNSETLLTLGHRYGRHSEGSWNFVCSSDGLVLLMRATRSNRLSDLKVWNPSIRKFHEIPSLHEIETFPEYSYLQDNDIGLGYDPLAKDYKLVRLIFLNYKTLHSVAIYSIGAGSWKIIKFQVKGSSCSNWRWECRRFYRMKVYFQGSFYFIAEDAHNRLVRDLVSFDLSNEVFSFVSMPDDPYFRSNDFRVRGKLVLIDGGCSLAVVDTISVDKSVWVLESEAMYWTKCGSFPWRVVHFLYLKKNGDILTMERRFEALTITSETGKNKYARWEQVASYSPETDEYKILEERRDLYMISHVCGYVESLILHK